MQNYLTFGQLDSLCRMRTNISDTDIKDSIRQTYINNALFKIYRELDGINDPFYNASQIQTVIGGQENIQLSTVDSVNKIITRGSGNFIQGSLATITEVNNFGAILGQAIVFIGQVSNSGLTANYSILIGNLVSQQTYPVYASIVKSFSTNTIDVSQIFIKKIIKIYDTNGTTRRLFHEVLNSERFADLPNDDLAATDIYYYWRGDLVDIFIGVNAVPLSTVTMEYVTKPNLYADSTINMLINFPPEQNQMLIDEVITQYLIHIGKIPPDANASTNAEITMAQASQADNVKTSVIKGAR